MSNEITEVFQLEDLEAELNGDSQSLPSDENTSNIGDTQWINELRNAMERGCDLGSIRNIAKCRPLPVDLRLAVWKVRKTSTIDIFIDLFFSDLSEY